jgi:hypothetical protein
MPLYSFHCSQSHETEWFGSYAGRPEAMSCRTCGEQSLHRPAVSKHVGAIGTIASTVMAPRGNAHEYKGVASHAFRCRCGEEFEDLVDFGANEETSDGKPCPVCEQVAAWIPAVRIDRTSERYPYFDRGLGMKVNSPQHRRDICANPRQYGINANKLEPVDGDWDSERAIGKIEREHEESERRYNEYADRLKFHPGFSSFRRARDQGRI